MATTPGSKRSLLATKWEATAPASAGRKIRQAKTEEDILEKTKRAIVESCKWISYEDACKVVIQGKTLFDR
eukprot:3816680-Amphidinium_carterae.1